MNDIVENTPGRKVGFGAVMTDRYALKLLLKRMFEGWKLLDENPRLNDPDAMIQACGGDHVVGTLLFLFGHWNNDIETWAAHLGIAVERDELGHVCGIREDVPAAPSLEHYWEDDRWRT